MKQVQKYIRKHHQKMNQVFLSMSKDQQMEATKVFLYLQEVFQFQQCIFQHNGLNYFRNDENSNHMETLIQSFWKFLNPGQKFYMYRIRFSFQQIGQLIQYWIKNDQKLKIIYGQAQQQKMLESNGIKQLKKLEKDLSQKLLNKSQSQQLQQSQKIQNISDKIEKHQNEFISQQKIPSMIENYQNQIDMYQSQIVQNQSMPNQGKRQLESKIQQLNQKMSLLQKRLQKNQRQQKSSNSPKKSDTSDSQKRHIINYKQIFDFYAKQTHFIGVKVTFGRIEHESQTVNYQKFVHFLRQFDLLPESLRTQKKIHHLYVRCCLNTRDLNLQGFVRLIGNIPDIVIEEGNSYEQKERIMQKKIYQKAKAKFGKKNNLPKLLNKPFHAQEKQDFRIDQSTLKYEFKIVPQKGKTQADILKQLQQRKKQKQQQRRKGMKIQQQKKIRYLRKLQSIDPFDPIVQNNPLLQVKQKYPVASIQNMQKFRDKSLDLKKKFGIQDIEIDIMKDLSTSIGLQSYRQAIKIQQQQNQKMKNRLSSIIEKSQSKMQKFSPVKGLKR